MDLIPVSQQPDHFKIVVYGPPDAGKTTFAGSGHDHEAFSRTLFVNIEGGLQSVRHTTAWQTPKIETMTQFDEVIQGIASRNGQWAEVKTLVVDSITELQRLCLNEICARKHKQKPRKGGPDETQLADYGDLTKATKRYAALFRDLPCNVIVTALLRDRKQTENGPVTSKTPDLTDSADRGMRGMFDNVWSLMKVSTVEAVAASDGVEAVEAVPAHVKMLTQSAGLYVAKTRNAEFREELPAIVKNPTLPMIFDIFTRALETGRNKAAGE